MQVTKKAGHVNVVLSRHDTLICERGDSDADTLRSNLLSLAKSYLASGAKSVTVSASKERGSYTFDHYTANSFQY